MICNRCRIKNDPENKFCINCGEGLISDENAQNICSICGTENEPGSKFCTYCGFKLDGTGSVEKSLKKFETHTGRKKSSADNRINDRGKFSNKRRVSPKKGNESTKKNVIKSFLGLKSLWILSGIVIGSLILVSAFDLIFHKYPIEQEKRSEIKSSNPVIEVKVLAIASKFVCSCGTCGEKSLEICACDKAIEERQLIRDYLEQNYKTDDIVMAVANKYGWLKVQFASNYKLDPSHIWNPNSSGEQINKNVRQTNRGVLDNIASYPDRYTIYSAFNCPCGQCQKDDLSNCSCDHPNGANQIKRFIDEKINENKYTINDIIQIVDKKFGGKKI